MPTQQSQPPLVVPFEVENGPVPDPTQGMIRLDVVVTDKSGTPVTGLRQQDFTLRDNGEPANIVSFQAFDGVTATPDPPVVVILVIDELDLPPGPLADAKHEAESFLRQNDGKLSQPVSIYRISSEGLSGSAEPSWDGNMLADEIAQGREPHVIWKPSMVSDDLAGIAVKSKPHHALLALGSIAIEQRRRPGRKLMFWLGRGWQFKTATESAAFDFVTEFSTRLREARIDLWSATEWPFYDQFGRPLLVTHYIYKDYLEGLTPKTVSFSYLALHIVATQTGGGVLETNNDLGGKIGKRVEEASAFYSLTFDPPRTNEVDEYHALKVEVGKPDLTAHTSTGYFDEPVFYDQPPPGIERVTVEQLEHSLSTIDGRSDAELARQLSCMELSERLSTAKLATLEARLKGKKARQALVALADESVFLAPPAGEIPSTAPPDAATQRLMMSRTVNYVDKALPKLPNFFANRTMVQYHERPPKPGQTWKTAAGDQSLYLDETFKAKMLFRDGKEVVQEEATKGKPLKPGERTLSTVGTFGPLLATVLVGATSAHSDLTWSRWEQGANGPQAVFRYRVPQETPLFFVGFGYLANDDRMVPLQKKAAFHGEFAVDPASGAILRLTVQADLEARLPLERSDVMVEYSPVVIGGNTYFCPARSVSIVRQRTAMDIHEWGEHFKVYAPFETILSDMAYEKYHVFHPTARMLPGFTPEPKDK
jgi:VWFA-related protein